MKAWFSWCHMFYYDEDSYPTKFILGINWYRHQPFSSKKFKSWRGFTVVFYVIKYQVSFHFVDDYAAYEYRMNYRFSSSLKKE